MAEAAPATRALTCPACGGTVELRAAGYTVTVACSYCSSVLDVTDENARIVKQYAEAARALAIPLGTRGTLRGTEWEVVGYLTRADAYAEWDEYLLFNPYAGYRWLVATDNAWSFGTMLTKLPESRGGGLQVDGETFAPFFAEGEATVRYVIGEFYWRVAVGETVKTADWVATGKMLSREENKSERSWTLNEWLSPSEIKAAFGVRGKRWRPGGPPPAPHEPSPVGASVGSFAALGALTFAALLVLLITFGRSTPVQRFDLSLVPEAAARSYTLGPVTLTRPRQGVTITSDAPGIDNMWIDLDMSLVDRKTQESYDAYNLAEHYSGRDSDGDWTEGNRGQTTKLADVPAGTYDLVVEAKANRWSSGSTSSSTSYSGYGVGGPSASTSDEPPVNVTISVADGARFYGNFFVAMLLVLAPMILLIWLQFRFESARRGESDF